MSCNIETEAYFTPIDYIHAQNLCLNTDSGSTCEECICVGAMGNDRNRYLAINKEHINCVSHIIQFAILNYKLFLRVVSI